MIAFVNRFRVYSTPSGLSEKLFDENTKLRDSLLSFPGLRARLELFLDPRDPHHLHYSLLTDLPGADTLETIMDSLCQFCDAFEQQTAQVEHGNLIRAIDLNARANSSIPENTQVGLTILVECRSASVETPLRTRIVFIPIR